MKDLKIGDMLEKVVGRDFEIISSYANQNIHIPKRATQLSAGYDIEAAEDVEIPVLRYAVIPTGLKAYMPRDEYLAVHIRSSLAIKNQAMLMNSVGVIDADYYNNDKNEGHILVAIWNLGEEPLRIKKGERIAQGIFQKFLKKYNDNASEKRSGGTGSTGK